MRIAGVISLALAVTPGVLADFLVINEFSFAFWSKWTMIFNTDFGSWQIEYQPEGCQNIGNIDQMEYLCMDVPKGRGHFKFRGQDKRCLVHDGDEVELVDGGYSVTHYRYREAQCTWPTKRSPSDVLEAGTTIRSLPDVEGTAAEQAVKKSPVIVRPWQS